MNFKVCLSPQELVLMGYPAQPNEFDSSLVTNLIFDADEVLRRTRDQIEATRGQTSADRQLHSEAMAKFVVLSEVMEGLGQLSKITAVVSK